MGRITTSIGLISGFPIKSTVDQLIALEARPRDLLVESTKKVETQQSIVAELAARLVSVQIQARKLTLPALYSERSVASSNEEVLSASKSGTPSLGTYQFTPIRTVQNHQLLSSRFASDTTPLGAGSISLGFGGFVDRDLDLSLLGDGEGFVPGKIRITDRAGAVVDVDLRYATTVGDVIDAVNNNGVANVRLVAVGDSLRLVDQSGGTGNLRVSEIGNSQTAASLGLVGIDVAANQVDGADVLRLFDTLSLSLLGDGRGVAFDDALDDLEVTLSDGATLNVDFNFIGVTGTFLKAQTNAATNNARLEFSTVDAGAALRDTEIRFVADGSITRGDERVFYDEVGGRLTFYIEEGATTADDIRAALAADETASTLFTAKLAGTQFGNGLVLSSHTALLEPATTATLEIAGSQAKILFTATSGDPLYEGVTISLVDNPGVTKGQETVAFDENAKTLTFQIDEGLTTADDLIAAVARTGEVNAVFTAAQAPGASGFGDPVNVTDTAVTAEAAIIEPVPPRNELSLGEVIATINAVDPARLVAEYDASGDHLVLRDLTGGGGTFSVQSLNRSTAAEDLGLTAAAAGDTITSGRLLAGLQTALLRSLDGGNGLDGLGLLSITDRSGASASVDLSAAETLDDVLAAINAAPLGVEARVNAARNGIVIADTTGLTAGNLIVANGDGSTQTADRLQIAADVAGTAIDSGSLHLQTVAATTKLASLNGGRGVVDGSIRVTDTNGTTRTLSVSTADGATVGQLLDDFNQLGLALEARINDTGDGILLVDTAAAGTGTLLVEEVSGNTARDLHLLGGAELIDVEGEPRQAIDGATTLTIEIDGDDSLQDLVEKINELDAGVSAAIFNDGSANRPFRFTLTSEVAGTAGELLVDTTQAGFSLSEVVEARDALISYNPTGAVGGGILISSSSNQFDNVVAGLSLSIKSASQTPVTITVGQSSETIVATITALVDTYNEIREKIAEATSFDEETGISGPLKGDVSILRIQNDLANLLTGRYSGLGSIATLRDLGIRLDGEGVLGFDQAKFDERFTANPDEVENFFGRDKVGVARRLDVLLDQLAAGSQSLLINRSLSLGRKIDVNNEKIEFLNARLEARRLRLTRQFELMELAIGKLQNSSAALAALAPLPALQGI